MGVSMSIGLASLNVFFAIGLLCLHNMGNYNVARDQARLRRDLVPSDEHTDGSDTNGGEDVFAANIMTSKLVKLLSGINVCV